MSLLLIGFQEVFDFLFSRLMRDESYQKPCASLSSMDARRQGLTAEVLAFRFLCSYSHHDRKKFHFPFPPLTILSPI